MSLISTDLALGHLVLSSCKINGVKEREKQAPRREPDVGLHPGTPGSLPGPKARAKPLSHPGIPKS